VVKRDRWRRNLWVMEELGEARAGRFRELSVHSNVASRRLC
jgi:hypothetical protein